MCKLVLEQIVNKTVLVKVVLIFNGERVVVHLLLREDHLELHATVPEFKHFDVFGALGH